MNRLNPCARIGALVRTLSPILLAVVFYAAVWLPAGTAAAESGTLSTGGSAYYDVTLPSPQSGIRVMVDSTARCSVYLYTGTDHSRGTLVAQSTSDPAGGVQTLLVPPTSLTGGGSYYLRVYAYNALDYTLTETLSYLSTLDWDSGSSEAGAAVDGGAGDSLFKITTRGSKFGAWRTRLKVDLGEADLYLRQGAPPTSTTYDFASKRTGNDGMVLSPAQFGDNQEWYVLVKAGKGAVWHLVSGDIYARDLGQATATATDVDVTIGPEGTYYFSTTIGPDAKAWRLWANDGGSPVSNTVAFPIMVRKNGAPVVGDRATIQQQETGQMLLVPPYLSASDSYLMGVSGAPGTRFHFDSHLVGDSEILPLPFEGGKTFNVTGYGYQVYRVDVPLEQIGWQIDLARTSASGNPELYIRQGGVPNRRNNDALSEAPTGITDSVTLVPPTLTNGTWYVTVYNAAPASYQVVSKKPAVKDIAYFTTEGPNDDANRSGWRYYRVSNIDSQKGKLGWQIELDPAYRSGRGIAIRRNALPAQWRYRTNDSETLEWASQVDKESSIGILQDPNHPADVWYVGVSALDQNLGPFVLTTKETLPDQKQFGSDSIVEPGLDPTLWKWYSFQVPADAKGWDLRLKPSSGSPSMVVRRGQLPGAFLTSSCATAPIPLTFCDSWAIGLQWWAVPGEDWRGATIGDNNSYLLAGMGTPLEAGTYYVGVSRAPGSQDSAKLGYTLESRGIGLAASPYPIKVQDLAYSTTQPTGGENRNILAGTLATPMGVAWYHVKVPAGAASWSAQLQSAPGEALLAVRQGALPNLTAAGLSEGTLTPGAKRQKSGAEYFYKYTADGQKTITPGDYYLAVVSEGASGASVGYTLTSDGAMPVASATGLPFTWGGQSLPYGAQKVYRFQVPAGLVALELRLDNRRGNPTLSVRRDDAGSGSIPAPLTDARYVAHEGGAGYSWSSDGEVSIVTIPSPAAGEYTVTVAATAVRSGSEFPHPDAAYDLTVAPVDSKGVPFASGTFSVSGQHPESWRFFEISVPADAVGWDLRLKASSGSPGMVVRRGDPSRPLDPLAPLGFSTSGCTNRNAPLSFCDSWAPGLQWAAQPGEDWTGRPAGDKNSYLIMGMGSPLEPGTYYVGVGRFGSDPALLSYNLESRGIGLPGSSYPITVRELSFAPPASGGGAPNTAAGTIDKPKEVAWYKVSVPPGASSWSLKMEPTAGEALLAVRRGALPNVAASWGWLAPDTTGAKRQQEGAEFFYSYPEPGTESIAAGDYYLAVVSEGVNPTESAVGTGSVNYSVTSIGKMPIDGGAAAGDPSTALCGGAVCPAAPPVLAVGANLSWSESSLPNGSQKVYRFRVPGGLSGMEVRLARRGGNPRVSMRRDPAGSGAIPDSNVLPDNYHANQGGESYPWESMVNRQGSDEVISITSPEGGEYTVTVAATAAPVDYGSGPWQSAAYLLEVVALTPREVTASALSFADGAAVVPSQDPLSWRYFAVTVPTDALGWDLRLKVQAGDPAMVVRRIDPQAPLASVVPTDFNTSPCNGMYWSQDLCDGWIVGSQWGPAPGVDWTGRSNGDKNSYLIAGMGNSLTPGSYVVGVSRSLASHDDTPLSYTLQSRGIGLVGSNYPIKVHDLAYSPTRMTYQEKKNVMGGTLDLPREVAWYRVSVPAGATSWSVQMQPTAGEALMAIRQGALPSIMASVPPYGGSIDAPYSAGAKRQKDGAEYLYLYPQQGGRTITTADYYLAVVSEGVAPADPYTIGAPGAVSYTLTSVGEMPIDGGGRSSDPKTAVCGDAPCQDAPPKVSPDGMVWKVPSQPYGSQRVFRFQVPEGATAVQVMLNNKVGSPRLTVRRDPAGAATIPQDNTGPSYYAAQGGDAFSWQNMNRSGLETNVITIPAPAPGDYTITVVAEEAMDSSYALEVKSLTATELDPDGGDQACLYGNQGRGGCYGTLIDQQAAYYRVTIPENVNGSPIAGWKIVTSASNGSTTLRVAKGEAPGGGNPFLSSDSPTTVLAPPYLSPSPGDWYIEVKGNGITEYRLSSTLVSADPAGHQRTWTMPARTGTFAPCGVPYGSQLIPTPYFGDSGVLVTANGCYPLDNPTSHDQGTDLAEDDWHFYRVVVPDDNGGLLRTEVEGLSGTPELYIREGGGVPSPYHHLDPADPNNNYVPLAYDRVQSLPHTMYGNWVPLDRRAATQLKKGDWWIGVHAKGSKVRYRLKLAAGNVRSSQGPADSARYLQDLAQSGDEVKTEQALAEGDMRYYRVVVPDASPDEAKSVPLSWSINLHKEFGDVVVFVRDTVPPGLGATGNVDPASAGSYGSDQYFQDWYDDNSQLYDGAYQYKVLDQEGENPLTLPPVRPGTVYYLGVYARSSAKFTIGSSAGSPRLKLSGSLPFANGQASANLAAGERRLYQIKVPANGLIWHHSAQHDSEVQLYLAQGTVPLENGSAHWQSSDANSELVSDMNGYPWQPGYSYYLLMVNTSSTPKAAVFTMDGRTAPDSLSVTLAGSGKGTVSSSPDTFTCSGGTCSAQVPPFSPITLYATPSAESSFAGWSGACSGTAMSCTLPMDGAATVTATATFTLNSYNLTVWLGGNGSGTVSSNPAGISVASGSGSASYPYGTSVTLTATPAAGNIFTGWEGACGGTGACTVTLGAESNVTATFAPGHRLSVTVAGTNGGGGAVNSVPSGIASTGGTRSATFPEGSTVTLVAAADANSLFAGWSGACTNKTGSCSVRINADATTTATFSYVLPAWIAGTTNYYPLLQSTYGNVASGGTIKARDFNFGEQVIADRDISVTVKGGYNQAYSTNVGYSAVHSLAVRKGKVTVDRVIVK